MSSFILKSRGLFLCCLCVLVCALSSTAQAEGGVPSPRDYATVRTISINVMYEEETLPLMSMSEDEIEELLVKLIQEQIDQTVGMDENDDYHDVSYKVVPMHTLEDPNGGTDLRKTPGILFVHIFFKARMGQNFSPPLQGTVGSFFVTQKLYTERDNSDKTVDVYPELFSVPGNKEALAETLDRIMYDYLWQWVTNPVIRSQLRVEDGEGYEGNEDAAPL